MSSRLVRSLCLTAVVGAVATATSAYAMWVWEAEHAGDPEALGADRPAALADEGELRSKARVILVTLDGARWQDVFHQGKTLSKAPVLPRLLAAAATNGVVRNMTTSSLVPISLPGYQAIYAGRTTPCKDNACARVKEPTVIDAIGSGAAVFSTWDKLPSSFRDGTGAHVDAPALGAARFDDVTIDRALSYWRAHRPRFMHLALLEMDTWGHANDAASLVSSMRQADRAIGQLLDEIARLPADERRLTTLLVTADHGRGPGALWQHHSRFKASRNIFVVAVGDLVGPTWRVTSQAELRAAIERLLGSGDRPSSP